MPPTLDLAVDQIQLFNKIVNVIHPLSQQQKPPIALTLKITFINSLFITGSDDGVINTTELVRNYQTLKYMPVPHLMCFLVLKAATLKKEDLDLVF